MQTVGPQANIRPAKPRQILVRLTNPDVKHRILKCRRNLKTSPTKRVFINEDLTRIRSRLFFHARQIAYTECIKQAWTTNGKILIKDDHDRIHTVRTADDFNKVVQMHSGRIRYDKLTLDSLLSFK